MQKTMTIGKFTFPVKSFVLPKGTQNTKNATPCLSMPMMSDTKWQQLCLESRLKHPERYAEYEDVNAAIARLHKNLTSAT